MAKAFKLPEKEYFTVAELAARWGCDVDSIEYYVDNGTLRKAFITTRGYFNAQCTDYLLVNEESDLFQNYCHSDYVPNFLEYVKSYGITSENAQFVSCPDYNYLVNNLRMFEHIYPPFNEEEVLAGCEECSSMYKIRFLAGFRNERYIPVHCRNIDKVIDFDCLAIKSVFENLSEKGKPIITNFERERFEQHYSNRSAEQLKKRDASSSKHENKGAGLREKNNRERLVAVLVKLLTTKDLRSSFSSESQLIDYIEDNFSGEGLSKKTLEKVFSSVREKL